MTEAFLALLQQTQEQQEIEDDKSQKRQSNDNNRRQKKQRKDADKWQKNQKNDRMRNISRKEIKWKLFLKLCKNMVLQSWVSYVCLLYTSKHRPISYRLTASIKCM